MQYTVQPIPVYVLIIAAIVAFGGATLLIRAGRQRESGGGALIALAIPLVMLGFGTCVGGVTQLAGAQPDTRDRTPWGAEMTRQAEAEAAEARAAAERAERELRGELDEDLGEPDDLGPVDGADEAVAAAGETADASDAADADTAEPAAPARRGGTVYAKTVVNIRSGPGTHNSVVRKAAADEELRWIAKDGAWYQLVPTDAGEEQWIHESVVRSSR